MADLAELYRQRWQVETSLAHLKTTMGMDVLHCQTVPGVLKELTVFAMVYNLVRMVMWHSAILQHIAVERISFLDALRWLGAPSTGVLLEALIINPIRPHRVESRVKKRRSKSFPLMIKPRQELRRQLGQQTPGGSLHAFGPEPQIVQIRGHDARIHHAANSTISGERSIRRGISSTFWYSAGGTSRRRRSSSAS